MKLGSILATFVGAISLCNSVAAKSNIASFVPTNILGPPLKKPTYRQTREHRFLPDTSKSMNDNEQNEAAAQYEPSPSPRSISRNRKTFAATFSTTKKVNLAVCMAYFCNVFAYTLPVVLLPMIAAESTPGIPAASFVAAVASVATLGGAFGKFVNGFVCQYSGGRNASFVYLFGMASATFLVSTLSDNFGIAFGVMEFFASIQWTACSVVLSNHYKDDAAGLSGAISSLALSSTSGVICCKAVGAALLQRFNWRRVAQIGSVVAMTGTLIMRGVVTEFPELGKPPPREAFNLGTIRESFRSVLGSKIFWLAGMAHATSFLVRASDKILGSFFQEATSLPRSLCGGLTMSVTLGFVHGLVSGSKFNNLDSIEAKTNMWRVRYVTAVVAAFVLALSANKGIISMLRTPSMAAIVIGLASATLASSVSFQFYQGPVIVSNEFSKNKAVCLSFMDGLGFIVTAPVFATVSKVVSHPVLGTHGWSIAWAMFAVILGIGGTIMTSIIPSVLERQTVKGK